MLLFTRAGEVFQVASDRQQAAHARVSAGITAKSALLVEIANQLSLPDYFGWNWDALDDCLGDLSWLAPGDVVLEHADVPLASAGPDRDTYLEILRNAEQYWAERGVRELVLTFPQKTEPYVRTFVGGDPKGAS